MFLPAYLSASNLRQHSFMKQGSINAGCGALLLLLSFLGDASYSIYLVHIPAISFAGIVLVKLGAPWGLPPLGMMAVMTIYAVAAGAIVHLFVEKPLFSMLSRRRAPVPGGA